MTGPVTVFVPGDSAACSVGADEVAAEILRQAERRDLPVRLVRNGSRGLFFLEPLIEVATGVPRPLPGGADLRQAANTVRRAYGPVGAADVAGLFDSGSFDPRRLDADLAEAGLSGGGEHPLALGPVDDIPWLARQQRVTFARMGVVDPRSPGDHEAHGGLDGLRRALAIGGTTVIDEVTASGLRGRGGAGFPTGVKWRTAASAPGDRRYVCCNADEGDSGTYADRMVLEGDPFLLVEGMTIAALAIGAAEGYVYIRSEYPAAVATFRAAVEAAYGRRWLGCDILGSGFSFDLHVRVGAGSYVCGEETAMLESLEGKRGVVRARPPVPAVQGLFGRPTVVNNVLTLAAVPGILAGRTSADPGSDPGPSRGTQVFQLSGNVARGGIVETPFGTMLYDLVIGFGGGTATGRPVRAVQVGGPLGAYVAPERFDLAMDYETCSEAGALLGHGGIVVFDDTVDLARMARFAFEFCAAESCGKCTPCRIGAVRGMEVIDRLLAGGDTSAELELLNDLCEVMTDASLCALGGLTPLPVRSALRHFRDDFTTHRRSLAPAVTEDPRCP